MNRRGATGFRPEILRLHREEAVLNTAELAKLSGITRQELELYEPGPDRMAALARTFNFLSLDFAEHDILGHGLRALRSAAGLRQTDPIARAMLPHN